MKWKKLKKWKKMVNRKDLIYKTENNIKQFSTI